MRKSNFVAGLGILAVGLPAWRQLTLLGMDVTAVYQWQNAFGLLFQQFNAATIGSALMMSIIWASFTGVTGTIVFLMGFRPEKPPVPEIKYDSTKARLFARKMKDAQWEDAPEPVGRASRVEVGSMVEFDGPDDAEREVRSEAREEPRSSGPGPQKGERRVALPDMGDVGARVLNFFSGVLSGAGGLVVVASRFVGPAVMDWLDVIQARIGELRGNRVPVVRDPNAPSFGKNSESGNAAYARDVISWYAAYTANRDMAMRERFREDGRSLASKLTEERREYILQEYSMRGFAALSAVTALLPKKGGAARQPEIGELIDGGTEHHGATPIVQPEINELLERVESAPLEDDFDEDAEERVSSTSRRDDGGTYDDPDANPFSVRSGAADAKSEAEQPSSRGGLFDADDEKDDAAGVTGIRIAPRADDAEHGAVDDGDAFSVSLLGDIEPSDLSQSMSLAGLVDEDVEDETHARHASNSDANMDDVHHLAGEVDEGVSGPVDIPDDIEEAAAHFRSSSPEETERMYHEDNAARHLFDSIYSTSKDDATFTATRNEPEALEVEPLVLTTVPAASAAGDAGVGDEEGSDDYTRLAGRWMSSEDGAADDDEDGEDDGISSSFMVTETPQMEVEVGRSDSEDKAGLAFDGAETVGVAVPSDAEMDRAIAGMDKSRFAAILGEKKGSPAWVKRKLTEYGLEDIEDRSGLIPVLWEQLDKAVDYQTRAFAWENFGETPPPELASSEDRERYLIKVATSILALKEQVSEQTLTRISEIKQGSEEVAWLNGRAERMLAALSSPENRDRLRNLVNRDTGVLRPLHESRTFGHMTGRGEPDGYRFREQSLEEDRRRLSAVTTEYRHVVDRDIKVYRDINVPQPASAGQREPETVVLSVVVGEVKEAGVPLIGIALVFVPKGLWRLVPNELGGKDRWSLIGEGENNGVAIRMRDHEVSVFMEWAEKKNRSPAYAFVHMVLDEDAEVCDLEKITDPEVRTKVWTPEEWAVMKRFHLSKKAP